MWLSRKAAIANYVFKANNYINKIAAVKHNDD